MSCFIIVALCADSDRAMIEQDGRLLQVDSMCDEGNIYLSTSAGQTLTYISSEFYLYVSPNKVVMLLSQVLYFLLYSLRGLPILCCVDHKIENIVED